MFVYRDKLGVLHGVSDKATAGKYAAGKVLELKSVEVKIPVECDGGFPVICETKVFDEGETGVFLHANSARGIRLDRGHAYERFMVEAFLAKIKEAGI